MKKQLLNYEFSNLITFEPFFHFGIFHVSYIDKLASEGFIKMGIKIFNFDYEINSHTHAKLM